MRSRTTLAFLALTLSACQRTGPTRGPTRIAVAGCDCIHYKLEDGVQVYEHGKLIASMRPLTRQYDLFKDGKRFASVLGTDIETVDGHAGPLPEAFGIDSATLRRTESASHTLYPQSLLSAREAYRKVRACEKAIEDGYGRQVFSRP